MNSFIKASGFVLQNWETNSEGKIFHQKFIKIATILHEISIFCHCKLSQLSKSTWSEVDSNRLDSLDWSDWTH